MSTCVFETPATITQEITRREPLFHRPEYATTRPEFAAQMAPDFWEVTEAGHVYHAAEVLDLIEARTMSPDDWRWEVADVRCHVLGPQTYLFTYLLTFNGRCTRRTTIWERHLGEWRARYHQGTVAADAPAR